MHWARRAASRAACTAGNKSAIKSAMIAITTNSSIKVKPRPRSDMTPPTPENQRVSSLNERGRDIAREVKGGNDQPVLPSADPSSHSNYHVCLDHARG